MRRDAKHRSPATRVAIVGSSGFIGSCLFRKLAARGDQVVGIDRVEADGLYRDGTFLRSDVLGLTGDDLASLRPDVLVHLAEPASVRRSFDSLHEECRGGLLGTAHLIDLWRSVPGLRLVYVSSAAVYGDRRAERCTEALDRRPLSPYGAFKAAAEDLIRIVGARCGQPYLIVRPFSVYGPGLRKQVVHDLAVRMMDAGAGRFEVTGTGAEERDFVYVDDCCEVIAGLLRALPRQASPVVNVGTGRSTRLRKLVGLLREITGVPVTPVFTGTDAPGNPRRLVADVGRLRRFGISCPTQVEDGLRRTVDAIAANRGHRSAVGA